VKRLLIFMLSLQSVTLAPPPRAHHSTVPGHLKYSLSGAYSRLSHDHYNVGSKLWLTSRWSAAIC
jgi:hypothetical protein